MSRAQRPLGIFEVGEKLIRHTAEAIALIEGSPAASVPPAEPPPETRECEGCGLYKPIEEMETVRHPVFGETYQCLACRGGP